MIHHNTAAVYSPVFKQVASYLALSKKINNCISQKLFFWNLGRSKRNVSLWETENSCTLNSKRISESMSIM